MSGPRTPAHAARAGVSAEAMDAIAYKRDLDGLSDEEALPVRFARSCCSDHRVSDETYAAATQRYGQRGVIELAGTAGYYVMSACWMNLMEIDPPEDRPQLPQSELTKPP